MRFEREPKPTSRAEEVEREAARELAEALAAGPGPAPPADEEAVEATAYALDQWAERRALPVTELVVHTEAQSAEAMRDAALAAFLRQREARRRRDVDAPGSRGAAAASAAQRRGSSRRREGRPPDAPN